MSRKGPAESQHRIWTSGGFAGSLLRAAFCGVLCCMLGCGQQGRNGNEVIVYTSQDQVYAEPILKEFEQHTGIKVRSVYDSEAVKTVGLVNRILAEQNHPQCDVFWNNEELRTHQLAARGIFRDSNAWNRIGYRSRRMVINTRQLAEASAPKSLMELTNSAWRGKVALAYPLFGTTATHFMALRQVWGEAKWEEWCRNLQANQPMIVDGNSVVVKLVGRGEALVGLTDSDDIAAGQRDGLPVAALPLTEETLLIPNTVGAIRNGPNPESADHLIEFLCSSPTAERLASIHALESAQLPDDADPNAGLPVNWARLLENLEPATVRLKEIFLR